LLVRWPERNAAYGLILCVVGVARAQELLPVSSPDLLGAMLKMPTIVEPAEASSDPAGAPQPNAPTPAASPPGETPPPAPVPLSDPPGAADSVTEPSTGPEASPEKYHWLDRARQEVYDAVWHSSMKVDRWFGSERDASIYQKGAYGSLAPAVLWDQYDHVRTMLRFNANFPLPQIDSRLHAFVGRVNPEEFITERDEYSGAFQRQYGPATEDETIFGLAFHSPAKQGGYFDAGAGVRISLPMNPYVKGSYNYVRGTSETGLFSSREIAFWDRPDGFGVTQRFDLERIYDLRWLVRWTNSGTYAQFSQGLRGYSAILAMRGFPGRRAIAMEIGVDGTTDAPVPLHDYGMKFAYRKAVVRRWLILEVRTSVDWPKDFIYQHRSHSFGAGVGFEMLFGTEEFLARPVTF
jgi:hypothetical protein